MSGRKSERFVMPGSADPNRVGLGKRRVDSNKTDFTCSPASQTSGIYFHPLDVRDSGRAVYGVAICPDQIHGADVGQLRLVYRASHRVQSETNYRRKEWVFLEHLGKITKIRWSSHRYIHVDIDIFFTGVDCLGPRADAFHVPGRRSSPDRRPRFLPFGLCCGFEKPQG